MNTGLRHVVVTRFNIADALSKKVTATVPRLDPDWLETRRGLFERFCLPSMKAQTMGDYEWVVLFDAETPWEFAEWFMAQDDRIRPLLVSGGFVEALRDAVAGEGWLATTRLDSDDALAVDYLETVAANSSDVVAFVDLTEGLCLDAQSGDLRRVHAPSNAFVTLIEPGDIPWTVASWRHNKIYESMIPVTAIEKLGWLQVIHDTNALSKIRGEPVPEEERDELLENFSLAKVQV